MPAPAKQPPAIGDAPETSYKLIHEEYAAPPGRKELIAAIERIISGGGVQRLVIQYGQPLRISRRVRADLPGEAILEDMVDDDLMSAVRNAEMEDVTYSEELTPFEYLFRAFSVLSRKRLIPKAILVPQTAQLRKWLQVDVLDGLYGVDIFQHKEMPDETLLIVGAKADEPDIVVSSLRLEMPHHKPGRKVTP